MPKLRLLEVSGSPLEMGRQHASACPLEIRKLTEDRFKLSRNKDWVSKELSRQEVRGTRPGIFPCLDN